MINDNPVLRVAMTKDFVMGCLAPKLSVADCARMAKVWSLWRQWFNAEDAQGVTYLENKMLGDVIFGKKKWEQIPGIVSVSDEPSFNKRELVDRLKSACPFFNEPDNKQPHRFQGSKTNRTYRTFMVIFFPECINGERADVNLVGRLFSFEKTNKRHINPGTVFRSIVGENPGDDYRTQKATRSYFALVSLDVIPRSRGTLHWEKINLLTPKSCRVPTLLEALISQVIMNIGPSQAKRGFFFGKKGGNLWTCTATDTVYDYDYDRLVVGPGAPSGLNVTGSFVVSNDVGVAAVADVPSGCV